MAPTFDQFGNYLDEAGRVMIPAQAFGGAGAGLSSDLASGPPVTEPPAPPPPAPDAPELTFTPEETGEPPAPPAADAPELSFTPEETGQVPPPAPPPVDAITGGDSHTPEERAALDQGELERTAAADTTTIPMLGEPDRRRQPVINQWYDLEQRKNALAHEDNTKIQTEQATMLRDKQRAEAELAQWSAEQRQQLATDMDEFRKARIDPTRVFTNASGWQQAVFAIGLAMGSLTKSGKNPALDIAFRLMDQDIDAQKANADLAGTKINQRKNLYQINLEAKQNQVAAEALTRAQMLETLKQKLSTDFESTFSNDELSLNYSKLIEEIDANQQAMLKAADEANLKQAGELAKIDETLANAAKLRADTQKILSKIGGGAGPAVPTPSAPAGRTQDLLRVLYPKAPPVSFGSDNVSTHFREIRPGGTGQELAPPLDGQAIVADDKVRDGFSSAAASADKMVSTYLALENMMLSPKLSWDDDAIVANQLTASQYINNMKSLKGTGAISDKEGEKLWGLMANLQNPTTFASMKSESQRRKVFADARRILTSGLMRDYQGLRHLARLPDGTPVEVSVEWHPRGLTPTLPKAATDADAVVTPGRGREMIRSGSLDQVTRGATATLDRTARADRGTDRNDVALALQDVQRTLGALTKARGSMFRLGPFQNENRTGELRAKLRDKSINDVEYRRIQGELVDAEATERVRKAARDPKAKKELEILESSLKTREKALRDRIRELESADRAAQKIYQVPTGRVGTR